MKEGRLPALSEDSLVACHFVTVWGKVVPGGRDMFRLPICALCGPMGRGTGMSLQGCRCHCSCAWTPKPLVSPPTCHGRHGGGRACRTVVPSCACPHCPSWKGGLPALDPPTCLPDLGEAFPGCREPLLSPAFQETR